MKHLAALLILLTVHQCAHGQAIDAVPRATSIVSTDLLLVQTNSAGTAGQKFTRSITASNFLESLMDFSNWTGGSSSSTAGIFTNVIYVNANGASQAANGALLTNAFESNLQGVRIIVGPGDYFVGEFAVPSPAFSQDNRIIEFQPGANIRAGSTSSAAFFMFDDSAAKVTNVWITGRANFFQTNAPGGSGALLSLENGSTVYFEHQNSYITNADSTFTMGGIGNNTLTFLTHGRASTWTYDNGFFNGTMTNRLYAFQNEIESVGDILEVSGNAPDWGDVVFGYNKAWARNGTAGQASIMQIGGRVIVKNGVLTVDRTNASIFSTSATTNGLIEGGMILMPPNGRRSVLEDNSQGTGVPFNGMTALWLKDIFIRGATNVDAFSLTNGTVNETILENVRLEPGWASTNAIRATTPSKVRIVGNLEIHPYRPFGTGITLVGTNTIASIRNVGTLVNHGAAYFSNLVYAIGNITSGGTLSGADITSAGSIDGVDITASGQLGTAALNLGNPTPSSLLMVNANGDVTNVTLSGASIAGTTLTITASGGGGTNNPVLFAGGTLTLIANQTSRHQHATNASFAFTIAGSSNRSSAFLAQFENTSTNTIYATNVNGFYSVELGSNAITTMTIPGNSMLLVDGYLDVSNRWVLTETFAPYALEFANGTKDTNHTTKTITYTAPISPTNTVLSNLIGTVGNNLTNESSTALQINSGTLSLSPGAISNFVASGFGAPYIAIGTNGGALANVTSVVFRSGVVLSNDSAGIASIHIAASSGTSVNVTNVDIATTASTNLVIDLGLTSSNYVVFKVAMPTNTHLVFSNASIRKWPAEIIFQQDTNGNRTITSIRSTDGLYQTNASLALTATASAMDKWTIGASYFTTNFTINSGL